MIRSVLLLVFIFYTGLASGQLFPVTQLSAKGIQKPVGYTH